MRVALTSEVREGVRHGIPDPGADLRSAGLRVTRPRLAVLAALADAPHASADAVHARVQEQVGPVSRQAVYDVLRALGDAALVRRLVIGNASLYELDEHDNHHHLLCRECGALADVPCAVGAAPCLTPSHDHGFEVEVADVLYSGLCPDCRAAGARSTGTIRTPTR